ncbi:hypothetical protein Dimus_036419, partial [Dionaea muscipula]
GSLLVLQLQMGKVDNVADYVCYIIYERISREREPIERVSVAWRGDWIPVIRKRWQKSAITKHGRTDGLITIFVDNLSDPMDSVELCKMFAKFGVVVDSFIPRKRSRAGRRFGFVRYDCAVAAEVTIHRTNGIWIQDKELK